MITLPIIWRAQIEEVTSYGGDKRGKEAFRKLIGVIQERG